MVGIPTCIGMVEFLLNFKFCKKYDEQADTDIGGMTICEILVYAITCGKSMESQKFILDDYIIRL